MVAQLDRRVRGQAKAKRDLADAFYRHYLGLALRDQPGAAGWEPGPQHALVLGPTGCGKTYLVRTLCALLGVPVVHTSATTLTETGYAGDDVDTPVCRLSRAARHDRGRAERGVVVLDEIDKIRIARDGHRDISGEGVQNGLLTLLDGRLVHVVEERRTVGVVDSGRLLFVCLGAFMDLPRMLRRDSRRVLGFHDRPVARAAAPDADAWERATADDLVRYGFLPEFVGRFPTVTAVRPLDVDDLHALLALQEGSPLEQERRHLRLHGIALEVEEAALRALAERAHARGTGARGLHHGLRAALAEVSWRAPDLAAEGVARVVVTPAAALGEAPPVCERGKRRGGGPAARLRETALRGDAGAAPSRRRRRAAEPAPEPDELSDEQMAEIARDAVEITLERHRQGPAAGPAGEGSAPQDPPPGGLEDRARLARFESDRLALGRAPEEARRWWRRVRRGRPIATVLALAEALAERGATVEELWDAVRRSGTLGIEANLRYLDFERARASWRSSEELAELLAPGPSPDEAAQGERARARAALDALAAQSLPPPVEDADGDSGLAA
jgi:ATP-dependent Clp protease ATP-binding subunit ClpX